MFIKHLVDARNISSPLSSLSGKPPRFRAGVFWILWSCLSRSKIIMQRMKNIFKYPFVFPFTVAKQAVLLSRDRWAWEGIGLADSRAVLMPVDITWSVYCLWLRTVRRPETLKACLWWSKHAHPNPLPKCRQAPETCGSVYKHYSRAQALPLRHYLCEDAQLCFSFLCQALNSSIWLTEVGQGAGRIHSGREAKDAPRRERMAKKSQLWNWNAFLRREGHRVSWSSTIVPSLGATKTRSWGMESSLHLPARCAPAWGGFQGARPEHLLYVAISQICLNFKSLLSITGSTSFYTETL